MTLPQLYPIPVLDPIPVLYPILDASVFPAHPDARVAFLTRLGRELASTGLSLLEYRNKTASDAEVLADALLLRAALPSGQVRLVMDDRTDVALAAGFDGVHVDAGDLPPAVARSLFNAAGRVGPIVGTSASTLDALALALREPVDYISFGPIFPTTTKQTAAAPIGLAGVRSFRALAGPDASLVAAAGITLATAPEILAAGASSVAVSAAIFRSDQPAEEVRRWLTALA